MLINPAVIQNKLRIACTLELNKLLFDLLAIEMLNSATEEQMLLHIRLVMVWDYMRRSID